jgi:hypothetical protein
VAGAGKSAGSLDSAAASATLGNATGALGAEQVFVYHGCLCFPTSDRSSRPASPRSTRR